jgi:hypothetical protein
MTMRAITNLGNARGEKHPAVIVTQDGSEIARISRSGTDEHAILFAAAPGLLAACEGALAALDALLSEQPMLAARVAGCTTLGNQRAELKAALNGARGESRSQSRPGGQQSTSTGLTRAGAHAERLGRVDLPTEPAALLRWLENHFRPRVGPWTGPEVAAFVRGVRERIEEGH